VIGSASTSVAAVAGSSSRKMSRRPLPTLSRSPSVSRRAANRLSRGKSTVAIATLNIPWGSM
jgi:hypothetical protein